MHSSFPLIILGLFASLEHPVFAPPLIKYQPNLKILGSVSSILHPVLHVHCLLLLTLKR